MATKQTTQPEIVSRKTRLVGVVTSDAMTNTATVSVSRVMRHPLYKKTISKNKKYKVHNTMGAKKGDQVMIEETRPISKDKRFIITKVYERHHVAPQEDAEKSDLEVLLEHGVIEEESEKSEEEVQE